MSTPIYIICTLTIFLIVFGLIAFTTYTLRRAYLALKVDYDQQTKVVKFVFYTLVLWLLFTMVLAVGGYYSNFEALPPRIFILGILPPMVTIISLSFSKSFAKILQRIPPAWLIKMQSFRILMELMLWLAFMGNLVPFQMTFLGFNMDIIAGITAIFAGSIFFRKGRYFKIETVIWNVFGILLLFNIVFITVISTPSIFRIFMNEPSSAIIAAFPFIWVPTFIVPYALAMHIFSIRQVFIKDLQPFE